MSLLIVIIHFQHIQIRKMKFETFETLFVPSFGYHDTPANKRNGFLKRLHRLNVISAVCYHVSTIFGLMLPSWPRIARLNMSYSVLNDIVPQFGNALKQGNYLMSFSWMTVIRNTSHSPFSGRDSRWIIQECYAVSKARIGSLIFYAIIGTSISTVVVFGVVLYVIDC